MDTLTVEGKDATEPQEEEADAGTSVEAEGIRTPRGKSYSMPGTDLETYYAIKAIIGMVTL